MNKAIALDGKKIANKIKRDLLTKIKKTKKRPDLAAILIGDNEASELYIKLKQQACEAVGINFHKYLCNEKCFNQGNEKDVLKLIDYLNNDSDINGILLQLPLPNGFDTDKIINKINPDKDVDGFLNKSDAIKPPTILAILRLIKETKINLKNKTCLILANSDIFANNLKKELKTKTNIIKKVSNIDKAKTYDVVISAFGKPHILKKKHIKKNAIIIDVGISKKNGKTAGDADPSVYEKASFVSPVPGGVGPLTVAYLLFNTYLLADNKHLNKK